MATESSRRKLTEDEKNAIISGLTFRYSSKYDPGLTAESIKRAREENEAWQENVRTILDEVKIDTNIIGATTEKIKDEFVRILETVDTDTPSKVIRTKTRLSNFSAKEIEDILSVFDSFYGEIIPGTTQKVSRTLRTDPEGLYIPRPPTLWENTERLADEYKAYLREYLRNTLIDPSQREALASHLRYRLYTYYVQATVPPGTALGSITAQNVGETTTQKTLNVHKAPGVAAARLATAGISRSEQIYEHSTPDAPSCSVYYNKSLTYQELKKEGYKLREVTVSSLLLNELPLIVKSNALDPSSEEFDPKEVERAGNLGIEWHAAFEKAFPGDRNSIIKRPLYMLRLPISSEKAFEYRVSPKSIAEVIERRMKDIRCLYTPLGGFPISPNVSNSSISIKVASNEIRRTNPCIDIYVKARSSLETGKQSEYNTFLRETFENIIKYHINGIPGIQSVFPYYTPLVRFIILKQRGKNTDFIMDKKLMDSCGVNYKQIVSYIAWRLKSLGLEKDILVGSPKSLIEGVSKLDNSIDTKVVRVLELSEDDARKIKFYGGLEPFTTFARLISDEIVEEKTKSKSTISKMPKSQEVDRERASSVLRKVVIEIDKDRLADFGIEGSTKLVALLIEQLSLSSKVGERTSLDDDILTIWIREAGYNNLVKRTESKIVASQSSSKRSASTYLSWNTNITLNVAPCIREFNQWSNQTIGTALRAILSLPDVNPVATTTDNPKEIVEIFGIEAHRAYIEEELNSSTNNDRGVDLRHFGLIADTMTRNGIVLPISRHGIVKQGTGPIAVAGLEQCTKNFIIAGVTGDQDRFHSNTSRIMAGIMIPAGTEFSTAKLTRPYISGIEEQVDITERIRRGGGKQERTKRDVEEEVEEEPKPGKREKQPRNRLPEAPKKPVAKVPFVIKKSAVAAPRVTKIEL